MAGVVLAFVLFGNLLFTSGGGQFLTDLSMRAMGRYRGGPAKMSVLSSSLFGTMTGSAAANVAFTGMVTIPLMKRVGYRPAFAGGVEAVASSGGLLAPPVMGAAAFLMAEFTEIPYSEVALAALGPALLYYIAVFIQVHLVAERENLPNVKPEDLPRIDTMLRGALMFVVPLAVLIYCLFVKFLAPDTSVVYATAALLLIMAAVNRASLRPRELLSVIESTGRSLVQPIVIAALAGLILGVVNITGLGSTLSQALILMASDALPVLLVFTAFASIVLGMGMPAVAIYILLAVLVAPALQEFGIEPLAAHLFIYYFGIMSYVTPPMAFACFVSGPMAGADPFRTGIEGMKLSVVAYVAPFLFVLYPELLLVGHWLDVVIAMATATVGAGCLAAAVAGFIVRRLHWLERLLLVAVGLALMTSETFSDVWGSRPRSPSGFGCRGRGTVAGIATGRRSRPPGRAGEWCRSARLGSEESSAPTKGKRAGPGARSTSACAGPTRSSPPTVSRSTCAANGCAMFVGARAATFSDPTWWPSNG